MKLKSKTFLPAEVVFTPKWWNHHYGIKFNEDYFFNPETRVNVEQKMERALWERFGQFGVGLEYPKERPVVGPVHLACGFMFSAMWGTPLEFYDDASPQVHSLGLTINQVMEMPVPNPMETEIWIRFIKMMDLLEQKYGYVEGDIGWDGLQNLALDLCGQDLFLAYYDDPAKIHKMYDKLNDFLIPMVNYMRNKTRTSSISVNRTVRLIDPSLNLSSNCSVQMISNDVYEEFLLPHENRLSKHLQPYGIHHCGNNMHVVAKGYAKVKDCCFFDVGWGSNIEECRHHLPDQFFNLRLSPVEIRNDTPDQVKIKLENLIMNGGALENIGICCINMDWDTPDENIAVIFETAGKYRKKG